MRHLLKRWSQSDGSRWAGRVLDHAPTSLLGVMVLAAVVLPLVTMPEIPWSMPSQDHVQAEAAAMEQAELLQAQAVTVASAGLTCWDPSTGRVGSRIVVEWTDTRVVEVVPFTDAAWAQAVAGEFKTLAACA